MICIP